jgi:DNA-binding MarR family transcriptional regulator
MMEDWKMSSNISQQGEFLEKIFHEPNRLSIMSILCAAEKGMSFNEIRDECSLTDGNLSRHLKALEESGAVVVTKKFVDNKPRTTVSISAAGLERFTEYLSALSEILNKAKKSLKTEKKSVSVIHGKTVRA